MPSVDDLQVNGDLFIRGIQPARLLAGCLFFGDALNPGFLSNIGFASFVRNGVGDYSLTLTTDPGPNVAPASLALSLDGQPLVITGIPGPGGIQILMTHLDGTFVEGAVGLIILSTT